MNIRKIAALIVALLLIALFLALVNPIEGEPITKLFVTRAAEQYMADSYSGTDFYIDRIAYSFKTGTYHAEIKSPTSIDTEFALSFEMTGQLRWDSYDDNVLSGWNTAQRLDAAYRALTDTVLESEAFPYSSHLAYGRLEICPEELMNNPEITDIPSYTLIQDDLVIDKEYDIASLGAQAGHLILYIESDTVTPERAAEIMLDIKARFDEAGLPFMAMDFILWYPMPADGNRPEGELRVSNFLYADIYEEGLSERIAAANIT